MKRILQGLFLAIATLGLSGTALANEYTDVIDAFDHEVGDPFDINISVGYARFQRSALIRREAFDLPVHDWDYYAYRDMFEYEEVKHILDMGLEIGLFRDLSFRLGLPLILNDQRELVRHDDYQLTDTSGDGKINDIFDGSTLKSPDRSGVDYISAGFWWGILDQGRDDTKPNWTFFAEGRFGVGEYLKASQADDLQGGISRGLNELNFGTRLSRRFGVLDPYFGFEALLGFPKDGPGYRIEGHENGQLNDMPPMRGTMDFGMEIIPWEIPEKNVKLSVILGARGRYYSEGRDYSPLFDALGTSDYFTTNAIGYDYNGDGDISAAEPDAADARAAWSGMTDVENYAAFEGQLAVMMQPAKYVKFKVGTILGHETEHFITKTDQCRGENMSAGVCQDYNFGHRPEIDEPGNRFRAERTFLFTFFIDAIAQF